MRWRVGRPTNLPGRRSQYEGRADVNSATQNPGPALMTAVIFEGALIPVAWLLARWFGLEPPLATQLQWTPTAAWGFAAALPLLVFFWLVANWPVGPFRALTQIVREFVVAVFQRASIGQLLLV